MDSNSMQKQSIDGPFSPFKTLENSDAETSVSNHYGPLFKSGKLPLKTNFVQTIGLDTYDSDDDIDFHEVKEFAFNNDKYGPDSDAPKEENSVIPEVAATIPVEDDQELLVLTVRVMVISTLLLGITAFCAQFYFFRLNGVALNSITHIVLAFAAGRLMEKLPSGTWLNPAPFNHKEHSLIVIICSTAIDFHYGNVVVVIQRLFLGQNQDPRKVDPDGVNIGYLAGILFFILSNTIALGLAGLFQKFLVLPAEMWWPTNLVNANLILTFNGKITQIITRLRLKMFIIVLTVGTLYAFFPQLLAPVLQSVSLLCLAAGGAVNGRPRDVFGLGESVTSQMGSLIGGGIFSITFDWQAVSGLTPMVTPLWSQLNVLFGNFALNWILTPILFSLNFWESKSLPLYSRKTFNPDGTSYNITAILDPVTFSVKDNIQVPPLRLSLSRALGYGFKLAAIAALCMQFILFYRARIFSIFKTTSAALQSADIHSRMMKKYSAVPLHWSCGMLFVSVIGSAAIVQWKSFAFQSELWVVPFSVLVSALFAIPSGILMATSNQNFSINIFAQYLMGYIKPGALMANTTFKMYATNTVSQTIMYSSNMKFAYYMKIPPRYVFFGIFYGICLSSIINYVTFDMMIRFNPYVWQSAHSVKDIPGQWLNANAQIIYTAAQIWGAISPDRFFGASSPYRGLYVFFGIGAALPLIFYYLIRRFPKAGFQYVNWPIIFSTATLASQGFANSIMSAGLIAIGTQHFLRKYRRRWYDRYNYIISAALDFSVVLAAFTVAIMNESVDKDVREFIPSYSLNPAVQTFGPDYCGPNRL